MASYNFDDYDSDYDDYDEDDYAEMSTAAASATKVQESVASKCILNISRKTICN